MIAWYNNDHANSCCILHSLYKKNLSDVVGLYKSTEICVIGHPEVIFLK